jgi:hypothetical protein
VCKAGSSLADAIGKGGASMSQWKRTGAGPQKFPRTATTVSVRISTLEPETDPDTGTSYFRSSEETTANLSRGGAFVHSWEPIEAGRRVIVELSLPTGERLQLIARVAWTRRRLRPTGSYTIETPGYGIEFVGGSSAELACLGRFLSRLEAIPGTGLSRETKAPSPNA